jgi:hypothetical protein
LKNEKDDDFVIHGDFPGDLFTGEDLDVGGMCRVRHPA